MSVSDYTTWSVEDVSNWLSQINLSSLVPTFERLGINGSQLPLIDDQFMKERLRMSKPSEVMALRGAIFSLRDSSPPAQPGNRKTSVQPPPSHSPRPQSFAMANRIRTNSYDKTVPATGSLPVPAGTVGPSKTLPSRRRTTPPGGFRQPMLASGTAQALLDDCRHCGWIIKQGGGYKSWRRRYLILRKGCLYYFSNETASAPKGQFILTGYKTEICTGAETTKKYKNILKLAPVNPHIRTYYIAVGSRKELDTWKQVIDEEIASVTRTLAQRSPSAELRNGNASAPAVDLKAAIYQAAEEDEDEDDETKIYEDMDDNDEHNYDFPDEAIYDEPPDHDDTSSDEDDAYDRIPAGELSPTHLFSSIVGADGKPIVPKRSAVSLQDTSQYGSAALGGNQSRSINIPSNVDEVPGDDPTYLPIIGSGPATNPEESQPGPSSVQPPPTIEQKSPSHETASPPTAPRPQTDIDYEDDFDPDAEDGDEDTPYYIMIPKADELLPKECIFDQLKREEADKLLRGKNRDGTYLIRGGSHAGADKVLSVWHIDRCRHYKLFKAASGMFSLTQGQAFRTIPELLQFYSLHSHLPRSDFYLGDPYNPSDY